jgi:spermidine synthase
MSRKTTLLTTVFLTGALVLVIEVVAVRILSPYFGNTIFSFSSILTVILAALSVGYAYGGRYADRHPEEKTFYRIILWAGVSASLMCFLALRILPEVGNSLSIIYGPLIVSFVLFFVPAFFLGMLSPFVIRLLIQDASDLKQAGQVSGTVFFWSTFGSITGSLSTGFLLIPHFGSSRIIIGATVILIIIGMAGLWRFGKGKTIPVKALFFALLFLGAISAFEKAPELGTVYTKDGLYEKITIFDYTYGGETARVLMLDKGYAAATFLNSDFHVFDYTKYFELYKLTVPNLNRVLVLGAGGYTVPKAILNTSPTATVDAVDIEPSLYDLSRTYLNLPESPRVRAVTEDGRRFLTRSEEPYDLIFSDVYYAHFAIPDHMMTREFFSLAKSRLSDDGVFVANVIGNLKENEGRNFTLSAMKTFEEAFPSSLFFHATADDLDAINIMFVGFRDDALTSPASLFANHPELAEFESRIIDISEFDFSEQIVFTDDYVPATYLISQIF